MVSESNWNQYKALVGKVNVVCLEVTVDTCRWITANVATRDEFRLVVPSGTQESTMSQLGLGESEHEFGVANANDNFPRYV